MAKLPTAENIWEKRFFKVILFLVNPSASQVEMY